MAATAYGAVTVINATVTGQGCALAIDATTRATWHWGGEQWDWRGATDDALARAVRDVVAAHAQDPDGEPGAPREPGAPGARDAPHRASGTRAAAGAFPGADHRPLGAVADAVSPFPPSRGLKTSSAAATALVRSAVADAGHELDPDALDRLCVQAARDAGVTLTGALDDQVAVSRGGCHLTDNRTGRILETVPVGRWHVAVWVPEAAIPKTRVASVDVAAARPGIDRAVHLLRAGDIAGAMTCNGQAMQAVYAAAGLPVTIAPVDVALAAGALGAGLSGTGPAVAALFDAPVDLPVVAGGTWAWYRAVAA